MLNAPGPLRLITRDSRVLAFMNTLQPSVERKVRTWVGTHRLPIASAVIWLLLAIWLYWRFCMMRVFDISFEAHNHLHWFRRVAAPWFYHYSVLPSLMVGVLIIVQDFAGRWQGMLSLLLLLACTFLAAVGLYSAWEDTAVLHQFVL
jgi:hypothetical protein